MIDRFTLPDRLLEQGYSLASPDPELVEELAQNGKPQDVAEVQKVSGQSFKRGLQMSLDSSEDPYLVLGPEGQVLAAMGVSQFSVMDDDGIPWMLGSQEHAKHVKALLRASRAWMEVQKRNFPRLTNFVDADYPEAIRWLKWLGFAILPAEPIGNKGAMIHKVQWVEED
jgi:hypothetical protein